MRGLRDLTRGRGADDEGTAETDRPTMGMAEAAARLNLSENSVRRWVEEHELPGMTPVAERPRDGRGRPIPGKWRKPYVDAVEAERRRRRGDPVGEHSP